MVDVFCPVIPSREPVNPIRSVLWSNFREALFESIKQRPRIHGPGIRALRANSLNALRQIICQRVDRLGHLIGFHLLCESGVVQEDAPGKNKKKSWTARAISAIARSRAGTSFSDDFTNTARATCPALSGRVMIPTSFVVPPIVPVL